MSENIKKRLMVIEDDQFYASIFKKKLSLEGYEVIVTSDGEQGLTDLRQNKADLILLDMIMPVKDGLTTLKELKNDASLKDIPVIILSNLGQEADITETKNLGAVDYIVKSNMSVQDMVEKVKKYIS